MIELLNQHAGTVLQLSAPTSGSKCSSFAPSVHLNRYATRPLSQASFTAPCLLGTGAGATGGCGGGSACTPQMQMQMQGGSSMGTGACGGAGAQGCTPTDSECKSALGVSGANGSPIPLTKESIEALQAADAALKR